MHRLTKKQLSIGRKLIMLVFRNTLTEAQPLRQRAGAVGLILSLEGARYYVVLSRQTRDQVASSNLGNKLDLHRELRQRFNQPAIAATRQQEYTRLIPAARNFAAQTAMDPEGRHAEESMIEKWAETLQNFRALRGRAPKKAEVFLTHCPCQVANASPSPQRMLAGANYPVSCHQKLVRFCTTGNRATISWKIFYDHPFGGVAGLNVNQGNLTIGRIPAYIHMP